LWNNGTAHRQREKRLWEQEQEQEWIKVLSKREKRAKRQRVPNRPIKKVCFVKPLVQDNKVSSILFCSFYVPVDSMQIPLKRVFGSLKQSLDQRPCSSVIVHEPGKAAPMMPHSKTWVQKVSNPSGPELVAPFFACSRCLGLGHSSWACSGEVCCKNCFVFGHIAKLCHSLASPKKFWRPNTSTMEAGSPPINPDNSAHSSDSSPSIHSNNSPDSSPLGNSPSSAEATEPTKNPTSSLAMVNFACNPQPYLPQGAHVEHGWYRPARSRITLGGEPPRRHEEYAIVVLEPQPNEDEVMDLLRDVVDLFEQDYPVRVQSFFRNPLGLGLVQFQSVTQR
jgi:hypothetical protein